MVTMYRLSKQPYYKLTTHYIMSALKPHAKYSRLILFYQHTLTVLAGSR